MGRPKLENARRRQYRLRLNDEEFEKILYLMDTQNKKVSEILRHGIDIQYNLARAKEYLDV